MITYLIETHDDRSGEITVSPDGRIESGVFRFGDRAIPITFLDHERMFDPTIFRTITRKDDSSV